MTKTIRIIITVLIGYFIAMAIRRAAPQAKNQITFAGALGAFFTEPASTLNNIFIGLAFYDLGHAAGFTLVEEPTGDLGKIKKIKKTETIEIEGKQFTLYYSDWYQAYSQSPDTGNFENTLLYRFTRKHSIYQENLRVI